MASGRGRACSSTVAIVQMEAGAYVTGWLDSRGSTQGLAGTAEGWGKARGSVFLRARSVVFPEWEKKRYEHFTSPSLREALKSLGHLKYNTKFDLNLRI